VKQYLLSMYQPEGDIPPPQVLEKIMRDVCALRQEPKTALTADGELVLLLRRLGRNADAAVAYDAALARCENTTERGLLQRSRQMLSGA
jgi:predicted RNA polymerase sigma factor